MSFTSMHNDYLDPDKHLWPPYDDEERRPAKYKVVWDNGHATDEFRNQFTNKRAAHAFGVNWKREMVLLENNEADRRQARAQYSFEVVPVQPEEKP